MSRRAPRRCGHRFGVRTLSCRGEGLTPPGFCGMWSVMNTHAPIPAVTLVPAGPFAEGMGRVGAFVRRVHFAVPSIPRC